MIRLRERRLAGPAHIRETGGVSFEGGRATLSLLVIALAMPACKGDAGEEGGDTSGAETQGTFPATGVVDEDTGALDVDDDGPGPEGDCVLWEFDACGEGQKCMPWSEDDDRIPDAYRCCAELGTDVVDDVCTISEYDGSCLDSCENGSMCVLDNPDNLGGVCRPFCNPSAPACAQNETCKAFFELLPTVPNVPMCMPKCDPLAQNCVHPTWKCIPDTPTPSGQSGFICSPPPPTPDKLLFDGCALANDCAAGLVCLTQDRVPGCTSFSCCSAYCSLSNGDGDCQALHPDMQCIDWMSPSPEWEDVGACGIPT
jgi:hypothetical protein